MTCPNTSPVCMIRVVAVGLVNGTLIVPSLLAVFCVDVPFSRLARSSEAAASSSSSTPLSSPPPSPLSRGASRRRYHHRDDRPSVRRAVSNLDQFLPLNQKSLTFPQCSHSPSQSVTPRSQRWPFSPPPQASS